MARELRFRCWDKVLKRWAPLTMTHWRISDDLADLGTGDEIITQYTGMEDKLGKEVWEGDIVAVYPLKDNNHRVVEYGSFGFKFRDIEDKSISYTYLSPETFRVIGNKFQNPELL